MLLKIHIFTEIKHDLNPNKIVMYCTKMHHLFLHSSLP